MRVAVFIDWMNAYRQARAAFGLEAASGYRGQFDPLKLSRILAAGNKRGSAAELVRVEIHRGQPQPNHDPVGHSAVALQEQAWKDLDSKVVVPQLRPVRYQPGKDPQEKGVDVHLAVCAIEWSLVHKIDVVVIFSHDSDLKPAVEVLARLKGTQAVETASWWTDDYRTRIPPVPKVVNHTIKRTVFEGVEDSINYGSLARKRIQARQSR